MPTALKEHEAGRLGGQDHRAVVWADEAIDALLDRSGMEAEGAAQDAAAAAAAANDILAGFKVAHFELQDQPEEEGGDAAAEADAEAEAAAVLGALETVGQARGFWETLLAEHRVQAQAATEEALGKGKRRRRQLMDADNVDQLDALLRAAELSDGDNDSSGGGSSRQHSSDGSGRESGGGWGGWVGLLATGVLSSKVGCMVAAAFLATHTTMPQICTTGSYLPADEEFQMGSDEEQQAAADEAMEAMEMVVSHCPSR